MYDLTTKCTNAQQYELELHTLSVEYEKLLAIYAVVLPKIRTALIADLLSREIEYCNEGKYPPVYTIQVFTKNKIE